MGRQKILIHSIAFSPDGVSTAYLYNDLALKFKQEGFEVVVLSTTPHYNRIPSEIEKQPLKPKFFGLWKESDFHGIRVIHIPQKKFKSAFLRIIGFVYWHFLSLILGVSEKNISLIISPSPPLTIGLINIIIAKIKNAKVIYNVQEIYPDFLLNQGKLKFKPALKVLHTLERYVYNHSDAITTIDSVFYNTIVNRFKEKSKLRLIPNFVDTSIYKPLEVSADFYNNLFQKKEDVLKIMYAGNIGHAQDWTPLLYLAKSFEKEKVEFWIIGEGVMKSYIEVQIELQKLDNVHIVPYQERNKMPVFIAYADLHFIFMSPKMDGQGFPSKVYTIMACAKPLLVASSINTPIYDFLKPLLCSFLISKNELNDKCKELESVIWDILNDKNILPKLGLAGYQHIKNLYSKEIITSQYVDLINELLTS